MSEPFQIRRPIPRVPWGPLGYVTFKRTYARQLDVPLSPSSPLPPSYPPLRIVIDSTTHRGHYEFEPQRQLPDASLTATEEYWQTVERVVRACNEQLGCGFTVDEQHQFADMMLSLRGLPAGRFLWQLGTPTVDEIGLMSLQNCAGIVIDDPITCYPWIFDVLMLGVGVGFNIEDARVAKIEPIQYARVEHAMTTDADFIVPDSRDGWVELIRRLMESHFEPAPTRRRRNFTYSTLLVRPRGTPIRRFGGVASGGEPLVFAVTEINRMLNQHVGERPPPVLLLDIANLIGHVVVSGNVRRSAEIAVGTADNPDYLAAKRWDTCNVPFWRANSNNSVNVTRISALPDEFWQGYEGNGEPYGLLNLNLCRYMGQTGIPKPDPDVVVFNPCGEQPLCYGETCCLAEVVLPNIPTYEVFRDTVIMLYRMCKHSLRLKCHWPVTEAIVHKNMRMGIGLTGIRMANSEQLDMLPHIARFLDKFDQEYSGLHAMPPSIRLRTVKPSGCVAYDTLVSTTAGIVEMGSLGNEDGDSWQDLKDVYVFSRYGTGGHRKATRFYVNRTNHGGDDTAAKCVTIYLESGLELTCTRNHRMWVHSMGNTHTENDRWLMAKKLVPGAHGLVYEVGNRGGSEQHSFNTLSPQHAYYSGYLSSFCGFSKAPRYNGGEFVPLPDLDPQLRTCITGVPPMILCATNEAARAWIQGVFDASEETADGKGHVVYSCKLAQEMCILMRALGWCTHFHLREDNFGRAYVVCTASGVGHGSNDNIVCVDRIVKVEECVARTFDIEVPDGNQYLANSFVSHNTVSLLPGVTAGAHAEYAEFYLKRMRVASDSVIVREARARGYHVEPLEREEEDSDGRRVIGYDDRTVVIDFPVKNKGAILACNQTAIQQLTVACELQRDWSDNAVSVTVTYRIDELPDIKKCLAEYWDCEFKGASFLLYSGHGFRQAPLTPITEAEYVRRMAAITDPFGDGSLAGTSTLEEVLPGDCAGGACPIR